MKCGYCGQEMREERMALDFGSSPSDRTIYTCLNYTCEKFNYPQKIEGLTL